MILKYMCHKIKLFVITNYFRATALPFVAGAGACFPAFCVATGALPLATGLGGSSSSSSSSSSSLSASFFSAFSLFSSNS